MQLKYQQLQQQQKQQLKCRISLPGRMLKQVKWPFGLSLILCQKNQYAQIFEIADK